MHKQIQIGNLNDSVDDLALAALFAPYGEVRRAEVSVHFETGRSTGVGLVEMRRDIDGDAAVAGLSGRENCGTILTVCWSRHTYSGPKAGGFADRGEAGTMGG